MASSKILRAPPERVIEVARQWLGTPYRHQASLKGRGADCLGLVRGVWRDVVGEEGEAPPPYGRSLKDRQGAALLVQALRRNLIVREEMALPGDVLLFQMSKHVPPRHCAILLDVHTFIHAKEQRGVVLTDYSSFWQQRLFAAYSFPFKVN